MKKVIQPHGGAINRFEPGDPKPLNAGRPPKRLTAIIAEYKAMGYEPVKPATVIEAYEFLLSLDKEKVREITKDEKQPMLMRIVGESMLDNKFGYDIVDRMLDRAHGRAQQNVNVNTEAEADAKCRRIAEIVGIANTQSIAPKPDPVAGEVFPG